MIVHVDLVGVLRLLKYTGTCTCNFFDHHVMHAGYAWVSSLQTNLPVHFIMGILRPECHYGVQLSFKFSHCLLYVHCSTQKCCNYIPPHTGDHTLPK